MPKRSSKSSEVKIRGKIGSAQVQERTPYANKLMGEKAMRSEYSRLRSIARKRLERLGKSEFSTSAAYQINKNLYKPLKDIRSEGELAQRLSDVQRFLNAKQSTVTGQRQIQNKRLATWKSKPGMDWLNKGNFEEFTRFLNFLKAISPNRYTADILMYNEDFQLYRTLRKRNLEGQDIERLYKQYVNRTRPSSRLFDEGPRPVPPEYIKNSKS